MPAKSTPSQGPKQHPTKQEVEAIRQYLSQKPDFEKLLDSSDPPPVTAAPLSAYDLKIREAVRDTIQSRNKQPNAESDFSSATVTMPVLPKDETASDLSEAIQGKGKDAKDQAEGKKLASAADHHANPGPVISQDIGQPESKEALKKRAEELNK